EDRRASGGRVSPAVRARPGAPAGLGLGRGAGSGGAVEGRASGAAGGDGGDGGAGHAGGQRRPGPLDGRDRGPQRQRAGCEPGARRPRLTPRAGSGRNRSPNSSRSLVIGQTSVQNTATGQPITAAGTSARTAAPATIRAQNSSRRARTAAASTVTNRPGRARSAERRGRSAAP